MVICPGGAYGMLALEKEGFQVAEWLNTLGVSAFVLRYRLGPTYHHPIQMEDGKRAMRWVRGHAKKYHLNPKHIGMLGFSAGGHLTATLATHCEEGDHKEVSKDSIDRLSCRPDFQILIYPVISMDSTFTHRASRINLLGRNPTAEEINFLSAEKQVTPKTPPAFIVHAKTDPVVSFQNSQVYFNALRKHAVSVEFKVFERGAHAFGLAKVSEDAPELSTWPYACGLWLEKQGWLKNPLVHP
jgi:acetyl esterase/lipase